jgi:cobalt-zinc-cadmium efflux system protein
MRQRHRDRPAPPALGWALVLKSSFLVVEVVGGVWTGSLALLADACHMLADTGASGTAFPARP